MTETNCSRRWEEAYFGQSPDAALGRLFRGVIHNLSGIIQGFSMQGELIGMTLPRLQEQVAEVAALAATEEERQKLGQIRDMLASRGKLLEQMQEKVQAAQDIMRRTRLLTEVAAPGPGYTVAAVIRTEVEFRQSEAFFKHKVEKELKLAPALPAVRRLAIELHQVVFALLANASEALQGVAAPRLLIEAGLEGKCLLLAVEDNGPGIPEAVLPHIYEPFFSTRSDSAGLGLYLVKKIMDEHGGKVHCTSKPGTTRFQLAIPQEKI